MSWLSPNLGVENILAAPLPDPADDTEAKRYERREVAAEWRVPLHGKLHRIEFEHGTTSGKRVIWVDEKEVLRREWMFKLVGEDFFTLEGLRCIIRVDPAPGFKYSYQLLVDGRPFEQFNEQQALALRTWLITSEDGKEYRVVLERDSLNIFLNGELREEVIETPLLVCQAKEIQKAQSSFEFREGDSLVGEFVDGGTDTEFVKDRIKFVLHARASGSRKESMVHTLTVNGKEIDPTFYA